MFVFAYALYSVTDENGDAIPGSFGINSESLGSVIVLDDQDGSQDGQISDQQNATLSIAGAQEVVTYMGYSHDGGLVFANAEGNLFLVTDVEYILNEANNFTIEFAAAAEPTVLVGATGFVTIGDPTLLGTDVTPHTGQVLTASLTEAFDPDGFPVDGSGNPVGLDFEWQTALPNEPTVWTTVATGSTFTVQDADHLIRAVAVFQDNNAITERIESAATELPTELLNIDENSVGGSIVALEVPFDAGAAGVNPATVVHEIDPSFTADGRFTVVLNGVDEDLNPRYSLVVADGADIDFEALQTPVEDQYTVVVNTYDGDPLLGGVLVARREFTIAVNNVNEPNATGAPVILDADGGTPREGDLLTIDESAIVDPDGFATPLVRQWQSSEDGITWTDIAGATDATFTPEDLPGTDAGAQAGLMLRMSTSWTDTIGNLEQQFSAATGPVGRRWDAPADVASDFPGTGGDDIANGNTGDDNLTGGAGADQLNGGGGNDRLDGGTGIDAMAGGTGDDVYVVDSAADTVSEAGGDGIDRVDSSISYTLAAGLENLTLEGAALIGSGNGADNEIIGNAQANVLRGFAGEDDISGDAGNDTIDGGTDDDTISGGAGTDTLIGGTGADTMSGGAGNDTYFVDDAADVAIEAAGEGSDRVNSSVSYTIGANIEALVLTGAAVSGTGNDQANSISGTAAANTLSGAGGNDALTGLAGDDTLDGGLGNDTLDGGIGADAMAGGAGNDTYLVDNAGDSTVEAGGAGTDLVISSIDHGLATDLENLTLTGGALVGTGNGGANVLTGNASDNQLSGLGGNDTLDGRAGADTLTGGLGNDLYLVDNLGDVAVEGAGEGTDHVLSSVNGYTLDANVENLSLAASILDGNGNDQANVITGNALANTLNGAGGNDSITAAGGNDTLDGGDGIDTLNGGTGADVMIGGLGNDTYFVDTVGDVVTEDTAGAAGGADRVNSAINFTLGANVEHLTLTDSALLGTGNELGNVISGNTRGNTLSGEAGADSLIGGLGRDVLIGGTGNDVFMFNALPESLVGGNRDLITDFVAGSDDLYLIAIDANTALDGNNAFSFIGNAAFTAAGQVRYTVVNGLTVVQANVDADLGADMEIGIVGTPALTGSDFFL